jgi:transcription initiation factor IIE alpha subunit
MTEPRLIHCPFCKVWFKPARALDWNTECPECHSPLWESYGQIPEREQNEERHETWNS